MKHIKPNRSEICETVVVDGVVYNKGSEPKPKEKPARKPRKKKVD